LHDKIIYFGSFFIPNYIFDTCVLSVCVSHEIDNCSDHDPLSLQLNICWTALSRSAPKVGRTNPAWCKANDTDLNSYKVRMQCNLREVSVPTSTLDCQDVKCCDRNHHRLLKEYAKNIANASLMAANDSIPVTGMVKDSNGRHTSRMPGWNEYVAPVRRESIFWHNLWLECGRAHSGVVADCMRRVLLTTTLFVKFVKTKL